MGSHRWSVAELMCFERVSWFEGCEKLLIIVDERNRDEFKRFYIPTKEELAWSKRYTPFRCKAPEAVVGQEKRREMFRGSPTSSTFILK